MVCKRDEGMYVVDCERRCILETIRISDLQEDQGVQHDRPVENLASAAIAKKLAVSHSAVVSFADFDMLVATFVRCHLTLVSLIEEARMLRLCALGTLTVRGRRG